MSTKSECTFKKLKNIVHVSEAIIMEDKCDKKLKPYYPTIKDTVQISIKKNEKPLIPTINEVVLLDKQPIKHLKNNKKSVEIQKSDKNVNNTKARFFNEKKNSDLAKRKRLAELRKFKLDQLQKTTKELAKASSKKKVTRVQDECKIDLPTETNQPELDQTWSPPPKVFKSLKKIPNMSISKKLIKDSEITCDDDIKNFSTFSKISQNSNTSQQNKLVEKKPQLREVTKPEHLFSKLKINNDYQLFDNSIFNISTSKIADNIDISLVQNDHNNVKCIEEIEKLQEGNSILLYKELSGIYSSTQPIDSVTIDLETFTGIQSPNPSLSEIDVKNNDHLVECQELSIDQCLLSKKCYSESTQTDNNLLSSFSSKKSPTPLNFISVLKCKNNLQLSKQNNLNSSKSIADLSVNEHSISNYTNTNNVEQPNIVECNNMLHQSNMNEKISNEQENGLNEYKCSLVDETIISKSKELSLDELSENIVYENKTDVENNDKLFTKLNVTNDIIKRILKKLNFDFEFENSNNNTNDLHNTYMDLQFDDTNLIHRSPCFSEIHSEFQAEIDILDQINDSLGDREKIDCDIKTKKLSIDDDLNDQCISNDMNFKTIINASRANNDDVRTSFSKLNALSSHMMSVDKSITGFSIQMFEQLIKDEELRAKQHHTILCLREKSLTNRLKWEVTMCDLHVKNFKNQSCYEKQLELFKQKHRGSVKKIEHSLFQVKKLGRIIDSVYKKRLIMLEEYLLQSKIKSSSKKVIRKLKSLDQVSKKEEYACQSLNSNFLLQYDKTDVIFDTVESKQVKIDCTQSHLTSKNNNASSTICELNKSKITLRNRATSPIIIETKFNQVENVKVQTEFEWKNSVNKSIQTSELFNRGHSKNIRPTDLSHKYESPHVHTIDDTLLPISPSHVKPKQISENSISTNSDQSNMEERITTLQEQLESRKLESLRLKKEQKKLRLVNLKAKEQDLLRQIDLYDKKIEDSKKGIMDEIKKKSNQVKNNSIEHDSSSKSSSFSIVKNIINYETYDNILEAKCQFLNVSDRITWTDGKKYFCPTVIKELSNQDKPPYTSERKNAKQKQNHNRFINNCDPVNIVNYKLTNEVTKVLPFYKEPTAVKVNTLKESHENQIKVDTFNDVENLKEKVLSGKKNEFIQSQEILNTSNNQELYLENNTNIKNPGISCPNINHNFSNTSSSNNNIQNKLIINFDENDDSDVDLNKENETSELETFSTKIGVDDDCSVDFVSDDNTSIVQGSYDFNTNNDNIMIEFHNGEKNHESSYEEERSEGEVKFGDKTFIKQYWDDGNLVQYDISTMNKVDAITNNIVNCLLKDTTKMFTTNMSKNIFKKNDLYKLLIEKTPLLMNLEEHNEIIFTEQATIISDELLKRHLQPFLSETFQMYLPKLDEIQIKKLTLYLKWSSTRKKLKLSKYFRK